MVQTVRHRQSKETATDMLDLKPPRHISTLPVSDLWLEGADWPTAALACSMTASQDATGRDP